MQHLRHTESQDIGDFGLPKSLISRQFPRERLPEAVGLYGCGNEVLFRGAISREDDTVNSEAKAFGHG